MRRVVVTGLGAVTPIGNDVPSSWDAALEGRSGVDFIGAFDTEGFPVRIAAEVKGFDPTTVVSAKEARKLDRNVQFAVASAKEAVADAGLNGFDPTRVGIVFGSAIGGLLGIMEQAEVLRERGPDRISPNFLPNVLVDSASGQLAITLGIRGPNYAPVSACATGSHAVGEGAELIRRGDGGRHRGVHPSADPGRLLCDARARGRGGPSTARLTPVGRNAGGVRDGRRVVRARSRGARAGPRPRRAYLRRGARLRHVERRAPHGAAGT